MHMSQRTHCHTVERSSFTKHPLNIRKYDSWSKTKQNTKTVNLQIKLKSKGNKKHYGYIQKSKAKFWHINNKTVAGICREANSSLHQGGQ